MTPQNKQIYLCILRNKRAFFSLARIYNFRRTATRALYHLNLFVLEESYMSMQVRDRDDDSRREKSLSDRDLLTVAILRVNGHKI